MAEWDAAKGGYRVRSDVPLTSVQWWALRAAIPAGWIPGDGQLVSRTTFPDLAQAVINGRVPVVPEAEWLADPLKRGAYTLGDGSTTIRVPDYNGQSSGSVGRVFLSGDGGNSLARLGPFSGMRCSSSRVTLTSAGARCLGAWPWTPATNIWSIALQARTRCGPCH